ncbi:MAG TPA: site-specific DNA-methyltransferase [Acidimicrobiales bacterium]|nr:site-specific DNA-methyltransferase [Acidimicrobiales bacterium]
MNDTLPGLDAATLDARPPLGARLITADVYDGLRSLPPRSVDVVCTSPPYLGRRAYTDDPREIGRGSMAEYLHDMVSLFSELRRILRPTGVVWFNIFDVAVGSGGSGGDYAEGGSKHGQRKYRQGDMGMADGQWASAPHRVIHRLQDNGWWLRSEVIWDKKQRRPEDLDHVRRPGESHEYLFMLTPRAPAGNPYRWFPDRLEEQGSVWHITPGGGGTGHEAVFPEELVRRCILSTTEPGDVVLDPFAGSGTSLAVAVSLGRSAVGVDFDPNNVARVQQRFAGLDVELEHETIAAADRQGQVSLLDQLAG